MAAHILILTIDDGTANDALHVLRELGHGSRVARSRADTEVALTSTPFDAILVDLGLGPDAVAFLEDRPRLAPDTVPVVLTSRDSLETAIRVNRLGVCDYVLTPVDRNDLAQALARALARRPAASEERLGSIENARLYAAERSARAEAEAAIRLRDEFLSIAAHELKTPITSMRMQVQITQRRLERHGQLDPDRVRHAMHVIDDQSQKLSVLVTQLLDVTRIQSGKLMLKLELTNLGALAEGIVANLRQQTSVHMIEIRISGEVTAVVDPLRFEQVVRNLLDNAMKYSPRGGPIWVDIQAPTSETVQLSIEDRGIGIAPEHRERVFDPYYQADVNAHLGGMGLGLYISQEIVVQHGGWITVDHPKEGGTRFVVTLPRHGIGSLPRA